MNDTIFKKKNKPALCTLDPVMAVVPKNEFYELQNVVRQKLRDIGLDYDAGCPKRHTCLGQCTGRPIYHQISELKPYIKKIKHLIKPDGMIYLQGCKQCPIAKTCKRTCNQVSDFMERGKNKEDFVNRLEQAPVSTDYAISNSNFVDWITEEPETKPGILTELISRYGSIQDAISHLPWGAINEKRQRLIRMYTFEGKDFRATAKELGYSNGTVARNEFYRALTALSKFATVRFYVEEHRDEISDFEYELLQMRYYQFLTVAEIAKLLNLPVNTVRSKLFRFLKKAGMKYARYVNRGKVVPSNIF
jgi:Sigma-70, region 4